MTKIKICGITTLEALTACADADYVGLVFHLPSPRAITAEKASELIQSAPDHPALVELFVNPDDDLLASALETLPLDMIQLHGQETPERVAEIKKTWQKPVMKALSITTPDDLKHAEGYIDNVDWLLFDSRSPQGGGSGHSFDWAILQNYQSPVPWMLAGGLNAENINNAINTTKPHAIDVSSGVEDAPGQKNPHLIKEFIEQLRRTR